MPSIDARKNKDLIIMLTALGDAYLEKGLYAEAARRYNQLLEYKVTNKHIYSNFSKALIGLKKFDKYALEIYQKAIQYEQNNKEIYEVLATSFLKDKRKDEVAIRVYEMAIRHDGPSFEKLAHYLTEHYFRMNDFTKCKLVGENLLAKTGLEPAVLGYFLSSCWQTEQYLDAINILKKLIDTTENNTGLMRHLCKTYLEKKFNGEIKSKEVRFSFIDRQLISDFLNSTSRFQTLQDLSFYIELKLFLLDQEHWGQAATVAIPQPQPAYAHHAGEGTAELVEPQQRPPALFDMKHEVLDRLSTFEGLSGRSLESRPPLTYEDFQSEGASIFSETETDIESSELNRNPEILLTIELSNFENLRQNYSIDQVKQVKQKLFAVMSDLLEKYNMKHLWGASNGLVIFASELMNAVALAVDLLNQLNRYNFVNDEKDQIHLAIGVHHSREGLNSNNEQSLKDFSSGLKVAIASESDLSDEDKAMYGKVFQKSNRIFLSAKAYRQIKGSNRFKVNSLGQFKLKYLKESVSLHEVMWRNAIDELKFGYIKKLSRFELLSELGSKGSVKVYKAKDANLQRFVILKVIQSEMFNSLPSNNPQKVEFYQVARAQAQMNHPNIVTTYDVDDDQGLTYIAREFVEAQTFTDAFRQPGVFNIEKFIKVAYQIVKGLQYCHRLGFFHLNLKPNNILVGNHDDTKIMDFLIPKSLFGEDTALNDEEQIRYMSPEQLQGQQSDGRSDIFSFGTVMYEVLAQRYPFNIGNFENLSDAILHKTPAPPSEFNQKVPRFFDALILKCLEKNPNKRIQSVEQIVNLLRKNFDRTLFSNFNFQIAQSRDAS